ncbi:MAG: hemopexin repeat-containing protein [Betaproteobacteria bacterium]
MSPDAVLWLDVADIDSTDAGSTLFFFKNRQFACWDVLGDRMLEGYPRDIAAHWPGLLESFPGRCLRGALRVPEWGNQIYFLFEGESQAVVWDMHTRRAAGPTIAVSRLLPTDLADADVTPVYARLADGTSVIYGFRGLEYTRWTVGASFPDAEDPGFPRKIASDWKDGLVLAPRAGVYVDWPNRSSAHSNRKIYYFMGDLYLRWDVPSNTRNYRLDIIAGWKGWPAFA